MQARPKQRELLEKEDVERGGGKRQIRVLWQQKEKVKVEKCEIGHPPLTLSLWDGGVLHISDKFMGKRPCCVSLILLLV